MKISGKLHWAKHKHQDKHHAFSLIRGSQICVFWAYFLWLISRFWILTYQQDSSAHAGQSAFQATKFAWFPEESTARETWTHKRPFSPALHWPGSQASSSLSTGLYFPGHWKHRHAPRPQVTPDPSQSVFISRRKSDHSLWSAGRLLS